MLSSWYPVNLLTSSTSIPYAIVILNRPINANAFEAVIRKALLVVCADGGANALHEYYYGTTDPDNTSNSIEEEECISNFPYSKPNYIGGKRMPDAIVGDLDSARPAVLSSFRAKGVDIIHESEQNSTDFSKCLHWIRNTINSKAESTDTHNEPDTVSASTNGHRPPLDIVVLGGLSGRVDQGLSLLHYLYLVKSDSFLQFDKIYLLSSQSLSFILTPGLNTIYFPKPSVPQSFAKNIGIMPLSGPTTITTTGLEWDVTDWRTEFGRGMMSTSNHIVSDSVTIRVGNTLEGDETLNLPLFTVELAQRLTATGEPKDRVQMEEDVSKKIGT